MHRHILVNTRLIQQEVAHTYQIKQQHSREEVYKTKFCSIYHKDIKFNFMFIIEHILLTS